MDMFIFAKRLKECRVSRNVSAIELGKVADVSSATIHRYEKAEFKSIKQDKLDAMANYLGVDIDYLTGKTDVKYDKTNLDNLSKKETYEIKHILYLTSEIIKGENMRLDGEPINEEALKSILELMELSLEMAKKRNK